MKLTLRGLQEEVSRLERRLYDTMKVTASLLKKIEELEKMPLHVEPVSGGKPEKPVATVAECQQLSTKPARFPDDFAEFRSPFDRPILKSEPVMQPFVDYETWFNLDHAFELLMYYLTAVDYVTTSDAAQMVEFYYTNTAAFEKEMAERCGGLGYPPSVKIRFTAHLMLTYRHALHAEGTPNQESPDWKQGMAIVHRLTKDIQDEIRSVIARQQEAAEPSLNAVLTRHIECGCGSAPQFHTTPFDGPPVRSYRKLANVS